jgi:excinuclease ABC subunit A
MKKEYITVAGACQNNLKQVNLKLPLNELIVITGVSGSGKSSLAFDTIYSEGQRRYVETFSPYARQFLDRMDKPRVERIEGIPPAIAIDQTNQVRTSRSTVGTMTEINDHLKLLFARKADLFCRRCAARVRRDNPESILARLLDEHEGQQVLVTFPLTVPHNFGEEEIRGFLNAQGYTRVHRQVGMTLEVIQDRLRLEPGNRARLSEALEAALQRGRGHLCIFWRDDDKPPLKFSTDLHCASCDLPYDDASPADFSFNSPVGACETCRGFGRTMGIDYSLVVPEPGLSLQQGAIKPFQSPSFSECQTDLARYAKRKNIAMDVPWEDLPQEHRQWVLDGEGNIDSKRWYGVRRFFDWLESKSYKMHIRVLLSKYRSYDLCQACRGARLKPGSLLWRVGTEVDAVGFLAPRRPFRPVAVQWSDAALQSLPGLCLHDLMQIPIDQTLGFFRVLEAREDTDEATAMLLGEIVTRLAYLCEVGLGYLSLDRQSRTLSGGEVQRINLTTALGTSLVNTLFVLDEPSIGLHPRDIHRIAGVLKRLRDAGNTLLVVEHDPQLMLAADRIIDMGPGPGADGGRIVFNGTPAHLLRSRQSLTAAYLRGERSVARAIRGNCSDRPLTWLEIQGASEHNLKNISVKIPLGKIVCLTGVSGSGKSTLMENVLYRAMNKSKGGHKLVPGRYQALLGHEQISEVVMVDQSPIGKTTRSNPASFVGALTPIRKLFAAERLSVERGYTAGSFSFNSGNGRCPACGGNGFEHVEMQFLSDVYLRCPDCDGRRFRQELLEVTLLPPQSGHPRGCSIADVLEMTVDQALVFFAGHPEILQSLSPLSQVGLGYVTLGQPVPTLSGGEAQRLKLAAHLAKATGTAQGMLFLFDEPTTGLHFHDIERLLGAMSRLRERGHSLVVIEHNLDVIANSDWIIDLGPEGGDQGGQVCYQGTPAQLAGVTDNHTGRALADYTRQLKGLAELSTWTGKTSSVRALANAPDAIEIRHAREHNLKNINIRIPRQKMTVMTGVSGSGKSTVAFDILFAEGQRRYLESLNAYARQFVQPASRPDVDAIHGVPPTVAIEQRTSRGGRKSTVGTMTEIYHFLRLVFVKLGTQYCPDCDIAIQEQTPEAVLADLMRRYKGRQIRLLSPLVVSRKGYYTDLAKWAAARGHDRLRVDGDMLPTDSWPRLDRFREHDIDLPVAELAVRANAESELRHALDLALDHGKGMLKVQALQPVRGTGQPERLYSTKRACPGCARSFPELDPRMFSYNSRQGWCPSCFGTGQRLKGFDGEQSGEEGAWLEDTGESPCPACNGQRLRPQTLAVRFKNQNIAHYTGLSIGQALKRFESLRLKGREAQIAGDALKELLDRLRFLQHVGLPYLSLDRSAPSLSGGEAQRIRLAAQLGSNLRGVCYILDEPTIGLHPRDNRMLLDTLEALRDKGNTVVIVEHDEDTIRRADHVIDLGPGAGVKGGEVVAAGTLAQLSRNPDSITGRMLANPMPHPVRGERRISGTLARNTPCLELQGANLHNLRQLNLRIPLAALTCVTGVSGSGKSTLVRNVLHHNLQNLVGKSARGRKPVLSGCAALDGWQNVDRVLEVDQTPIGKTPRSCPATYVGIWDHIRKLFAGTEEARLRGFNAGRFSFNTAGGRCAGCEGQGLRKIEMNFLPDVRVNCEVCAGARFNRETLEVHYRGKNIAQVLGMSIDEALEYFAPVPRIHGTLQLLQDVGLGYLTLGQQSPTLSGGEAQRIKLVTELAKARPVIDLPGRKAVSSPTLYILDEPTVGLHMADVEKLVMVIHRLVDAGNTALVIEHNLDLIAEADWVVDMGPEGGTGGGRIVIQGTPEKILRSRRSHTAPALAPLLAR